MTLFLYCGATISRLKRPERLSGQVALKIILAKTVKFKTIADFQKDISALNSVKIFRHWRTQSGRPFRYCLFMKQLAKWQNRGSLPEEASHSRKNCDSQSCLLDFRLLLNRRRKRRLWNNDTI